MSDPASLIQPVRQRRQRVVQALLILVVLGATVGILRVVVQSNLLLGRMTTDVAALPDNAKCPRFYTPGQDSYCA